MRRHRSSKTLTAPCDKSICVRWTAIVFGTIALLLMAVACAPSKKKLQYGSAEFVTTVSNEKAALMYAAPQLDCETPNGICPEPIALLASRTSVDPRNTEITQCTSFLVSRDIIATNSHCIPQDLRKKNSNCSGRIQAIFGKTTFLPQQSYDCERVLQASEITDDESDRSQFMKHPDYAFFRVKKDVVRRKPLKLTREGLPDRLELKIFAIDPSRDEEVRGTLRVRTCLTIQGSVNIPSYVHDFAPIAAAGPCDTIQGNSGSAAVDANGQVRAFHYGASLPSTFRSTNIEVPEKMLASVYLTNVACIDAPHELRLLNKNPRCESKPITQQELFDRARGKSKSRAAELFEAWKPGAPTQFKFVLDDNRADGVAYPRVACLNDRSLIANDPKTVQLELPVWGPQLVLSADSRMKAVSKELLKASATVTVKNLGGPTNDPVIQYQEIIHGAAPFGSVERSDRLPVCD